jgi:hypothetical protein
MLIPEPVPMLPHLAEKGYVNELKLRICKGDYPCGLNSITSSLEVKKGSRDQHQRRSLEGRVGWEHYVRFLRWEDAHFAGA